jgi:hypothetical protein
MQSYVADPNRLRGNAAEMRMLAGGATDITVRRLMCRLADGWEKLADRAERRAPRVTVFPRRRGATTSAEKLISPHRSAYIRSGNGTAG